MADEKETLNSFDFGIQDGDVFGNASQAEAFLSGTDVVTTDADDLAEAEEEDIKPKKKEVAPAKKEAPKVDAAKLAEELLGEESEEEEQEEEVIPKEEEEESSGNQFEAITKELYKAGVFSLDEDEEEAIATTPEEFLELFNHEKQKGATIWLENFLAKHGDDRKELFEAIFVNGVEPRKWVETYLQVEDFSNLDLQLESNQEKVVREYYKRGGLTPEKIQAKIEKLKSYSDLEDEAASLHPLIVEQDREKLTEMEENKKLELQKQSLADTQYKESITKLLQTKLKEKQIDGLPLDEKTARASFDFLYTKKWKTPSGELLTDFDRAVLESKKPENIANRLKLALLFQNNFDFSKIEKKAIGKESSTLFASLARQKEKKSSIQTKRPSSAFSGLI